MGGFEKAGAGQENLGAPGVDGNGGGVAPAAVAGEGLVADGGGAADLAQDA